MAGISEVAQLYVLSCSGLVLFMTPGLALFYGGLVRERAVIDMMIQNFVSLGITTVLWYGFLFSTSFAPGDFIGSLGEYSMYKGLTVNTPWETLMISGPLFATFQGMFAIITPILMTGAFADRMRFGPFCVFLTLWLTLVYSPWCHQIWGGGLLMKGGVWDFAGGIVVHTTAGWSALAACLALGNRKAKIEGGDISEPHSVPIVVVGTGILWFGWFGFNGGSALEMNGTAVAASINSQISAGIAVCVWGAIDWFREGKAKLVPMCIACVAGLVVITPSAGYISTNMACVVGLLAGTVCYSAVYALNAIGVDDALDVWGVHGVGGAMGTILIGFLADGEECLDKTPPDYCVFPHSVAASSTQVLIQVKAVALCIIYSFTVTYAIIKVMSLVVTVKPDDSTDDFVFDNLDIDLHGESGYTMAPMAAAGEDSRSLLPPTSKTKSHGNGEKFSARIIAIEKDAKYMNDFNAAERLKNDV
jgi:Amt family ammonium transporter